MVVLPAPPLPPKVVGGVVNLTGPPQAPVWTMRPPGVGPRLLPGAIPLNHAAAQTRDSGGGSGGVQIELWQVINLVGAPLLAVLFAQPVIDDLKAWFASERNRDA